MLSLDHGQQSASKCFVTHGRLSHVDSTKPPLKNKPFSTVLSMGFCQKVELILPQETWEEIRAEVSSIPKPVFSKVNLPLSALIEGEFFNEYIKKGNVLMLSEGRPGVDNVYWLREGILTLSLDKESYERAGIAGKPDGVKGKRGHRARWIVEINLRLPSMLHGKKGFDRIVHAFTNVLTSTVSWLFSNVGNETPSPDPLTRFIPRAVVVVDPEVSQAIPVQVPVLQPPVDLEDQSDFDEFTTDLYEWLSLISLQSPRVRSDDKIDSFLSRYTPPEPALPDQPPVQVVKVSWRGFLAASWAHKLLVCAMSAATRNQWLSFGACGFNPEWSPDYRDFTVLQLPKEMKEFISWEVVEG